MKRILIWIIAVVLVILVIGLSFYIGYFQSKYAVRVVGFRHGKMLVERSYCSDVCPANTRIDVIYWNVENKEQCEAVGGTPLVDAAWRAYIGCSPAE